MTQRIHTGPASVEWLWDNAFIPNEHTKYGTRGPTLVDMWRTSFQNMKHQSSLRRCVITGGSENAARVSQRMDCWIGVIEFHVSANNKKVSCNMAHVCGSICYLYPRPTKLEGGGGGGGGVYWIHLVRPSVRPSVCRRHGFRSISQVSFGISISNFIRMLMVAIGRSLLIFSDIT